MDTNFIYEILSYIPSVQIIKLCSIQTEIHVLILKNHNYSKILKYRINYRNPYNLIYYKRKYTDDITLREIIDLYEQLYRQETIHCFSENINEIPILPLLKNLDCRYNQLEEINDFPLLNTLDCAENQITRINNLPSLETLLCSSNSLKVISDLPSLQVLDCRANPVKLLKNLPKLETLYHNSISLRFIDVKTIKNTIID